MNKEIRTEIEIDAPASRVWEVLTDIDGFQRWNPFVTRVSGDLRVGNTLRIEVHIPGGSNMKFAPTVLAADPDRELRWVGSLPFGAFRGEHFYLIEPISEDRVRFVHGEHFSGWAVGLIWRIQGAKIEAGYRLMNEAIKTEAEKC